MKGIYLTEADNEDMVSIIQKMVPSAPQFKLILESQMKNATAKDPRHRRWKPEIISLCLNLWAKYVTNYISINFMKLHQ